MSNISNSSGSGLRIEAVKLSDVAVNHEWHRKLQGLLATQFG